MTIPAKSVMTTDIVTVSPETTVAETARRMLIHHVTAVPVVDPDNRPLGLVSEGDVMRHFGAQFQSKRAQWLRMLAEGETLAPEFLAEIRLNQQHVRGIMHTAIISADEEASLAELADLMLKLDQARPYPSRRRVGWHGQPRRCGSGRGRKPGRFA